MISYIFVLIMFFTISQLLNVVQQSLTFQIILTTFLKQPPIKIRNNKVKSKGVRPQNTRNALDFITGKNIEHKVYSRKNLSIGSKIIGPAIIEEDQTTTLIPKNFAAQINGYGYLVIEEHIT